MGKIAIFITFLLTLLLGFSVFAQSRSLTLHGFVRESGSQEVFAGANVRVEGLSAAAVTNAYGYYQLRVEVPENRDSLVILASMAGYQVSRARVSMSGPSRLDWLLEPTQLEEVVVRQSVERSSEQATMSSQSRHCLLSPGRRIR